jgi:small-conductance mechanosensitive channel
MGDINNFPALLAALAEPAALLELALLLACLGLAWLATVMLRPRSNTGSVWFGQRGYDGVLFPLLALALALLARLLLRTHLPVAVFKLAVPILTSLALIRVTVRVLHLAFPNSPLMRALERWLSWAFWLGAVLWTTGLLPAVLAESEVLTWRISGSPVSLRSLIEGALSAVAVMLVMLWLSATLEARLLRASGINLSVRKMAANATRAILLLVGILIAMSTAGIPLAALSVLGGAVGVGIGLGLQKLAANYVSGFVILAERSLRIGDVVKVDGFEGRITDISTRYTVIRAANGRESIVPNEMMVTQRVENCSFADPKVAVNSLVQVAYGTDLDTLLPRLVDAMRAVPRVLSEPGPSVQLSNFAADGLELTLIFWIADMENGTGNVRSGVHLAVLRVLNADGIEIPFPQRVLHGLPAAAVSPATSATATALAALATLAAPAAPA